MNEEMIDKRQVSGVHRVYLVELTMSTWIFTQTSRNLENSEDFHFESLISNKKVENRKTFSRNCGSKMISKLV
jgi:hypothetical protein